MAGGTAVTITGTNYAAGATVKFGATAATNVVVVSSTSITATTPAGTAGAVTVTVTVGGQSGSLASGFTYVVAPTVSSVSPNSGAVAGGTAVTITGTNYAAGATVTFGATAATNVVVVSSTSITATTPAGSGAVTVTVTNSNGQSGSLTNGFTYAAAPTVSSVSPNSGTTAGGTAVTITGTNYAAGATVKFGATAATNVVVVSSTSITATTPAGTAGAVTVTVTVGGQSGSLASGFTYVVAPTVSSVSPNSGAVAGGTAVTITGTNYAAGATVKFGATAATNVVVVSSTSITATTPAGSGAVTVTVTNSNGQSGSLTNGFSYAAAPTVSSVSPNSGTTAGGTAVTITGTNYAAGATVKFGATAATNVVVVSSTSITATTPAGTAGAVTVTVTVGGQSGSLASGFTYVVAPTVSSVSPSSGPVAGGTAVTITGTNYAAGATVKFGATAATNVVVVSGTSITATTPAGSGAVTVTVTNSNGQSGSLTNGFSYTGTVAISFGQVASATPQSATASVAVTYPAAETAGDLNVVVVGWNDTTATVQSVRDSAGNTYSPAIGPTIGAGLQQSIYYAAGIVGGNNTVTVTFSQAAAFPDVRILEYRGVTTLDVTSGASGNSTAANSGAATTTSANELIFGAATVATLTKAAGTGFTSRIITTPNGDNAEDKLVTTAGSNSATATLTDAGPWVMQMVTFSAATGPVPTVSSVSPNSGAVAGGTAVTITGTNFAAGATVTFGATAATNVVVVNSTSITATTPAGTAGAVAVMVTNPGGQSGSLAGGFTYVAAPTVSSVSPNSGAVAGGTAVTITGTNFAAGATVTFGAMAATNVVVVSGTSITATTPAGSGAVTVTVTNSNGQSGSLTNGFTYAAAPTVSSVSPNSGTTAGGTAVTITGTNYAAGATVKFGATAATNVVVVSSTSITATTPAGTAGAVTVTVTVGGQTGSLASGFTYVVAPTVSSVSPNSGAVAGGTAVTITGTNYAAGATVKFGATAATNVVVVSGTSITATTPAGSGAVTVTVTNSNGQSGSLTNGFTYAAAPTVSSVSPNSGTTAGGTAVTITGTNYAAGATVKFGATAATNVVVVSSTSITATTPAGTAGAVTVTVTVGGQSGSLASGFTYVITAGITAPGNFAGALMGTSAPTYVAGQQYYNATAGTSFTSASFNSTGADLLVMFLGCHNITAFTITDSYGNTWLPLAGPAYKVGTASFPMEGEFFYAPNATTGAGHTVTVGLSQTEPLVMSIAALSGDNIYSPIDSYSSITGDNGTVAKYVASTPLTTSQPNDLLLGIVKGFGNNSYAAGTGYTAQLASTGLNFGAETQTASSVGNYTSSFTASVGDFWQTVIAAIAPKPNQTALSWTASTGGIIANYFIERCAGLGCTGFSQIASVAGSALSYTDTTISSGTIYNYRVRAGDSSGSLSPYSNVLALSPIVPHVVSGFAATPTRNLSWNASAESGGLISQYSVERCTGLSCSNFSQIATTSSTSYTDTSASAGSTYNYRVRAQDTNNFYGPYSVTAAASVPSNFDNAADGGNNGGSTQSLTYSYTVGTNSNRLLLVNVVGDTSADDISSVTYSGASMTLLKKVQTPGDRWHYLYYLLAPASGPNNVVITAGSAHYLISEATSWNNVAQTGQPLANATNTAAGGAISMTTSLPASSNNVIVAESMWAPVGILPGNGSSELIADSAFQSLGMFTSVASLVTQAFPVSITNTWGGQAAGSSIIASFTLASNGTPGITFDNSTDGGNNGGSTTSLTYSYTVGTSLNRLLVVNLIGDSSADDITSVTCAGIPMTFAGKVQAPASNNWQYFYYLLNPPSGTNNIVATAASQHYLISQAASWFNVRQTAQPDAFTTNTLPATNTSATTSLKTIAAGSLVVQGVWSFGRLAAGTGATPIVIDAAIGGAAIFASSGSPVSPAGSVNMTTMSDGTMSTGVIMVSFAPAP